MKNKQNFWRSLFQRTFWLYVFGAIIFLSAVNSRQAAVNRLNNLKWVEAELLRFSEGEQPFEEDTLRWAVRYYKILEKLYGSSGVIDATLGYCHFYLGELEESRRFYRQAIAREPGFYMFPMDLGFLEFRAGRFDEAQKAFHQAWATVTLTRRYYAQIEQGLRSQRRLEVLRLVYGLQKKLEEDAVKIALALIDVLLELRLGPAAQEWLLMALAQYPQNREVQVRQGLIFLGMKDYGKAEDSFSKALTVSPDFVEAYYYRGQCRRVSGQLALAHEDLTTAQKLKEQGVRPMENLLRTAWLHDNTLLLRLMYQLSVSR